MLHGVENLFGCQADVHRVQHRTYHGNGEEAFQIAVAVPIHHRHHISCLHSLHRQQMSQLMDPLLKTMVVVTALIAVHDLIIARHANARLQQILDQHGRVGGGGCRRKQFWRYRRHKTYL
tara:strand:+ start:3751 stop:4110 length:360 start_codon:yes stop_codon:yes gene_type:complete